MIGLVSLAVVTLGTFGGQVPESSADTLEAIERADSAYRQHQYLIGEGRDRGGRTRQEYHEYLGWGCSAEDGDECFGGDWVAIHCPANVACNPADPARLMVLFYDLALDHPESGYVTGHAVFTLTRFGEPLKAMEVATACEAAVWWCDVLRGYVFHHVGRLDQAEAALRRAAEAAPVAAWCTLSNPGGLIGPWVLEEGPATVPRFTQAQIDAGCPDRAGRHAWLWWLSDPLYIVEGNDRWVEHIARAFTGVWYQEAKWTTGGATETSYYIDRRRLRIERRGPWDSFEILNPAVDRIGYLMTTSQGAARYHFVPDFAEDDDDLNHPTWRLEATPDDEGYTPPYGPFYRLPLQVARFRHRPEGDSLLIATAGLTTGSPIEEAATSAYLVLSDAPESFPLQLEAPFHEGRAVFLPQAPAERYVLSFEVLSEAGIGRHRLMLEPLETGGPGLSDLLLYRPMGAAEPDSLLAAASLMLGTTAIDDPAEVGLYWELYGVDSGETVEFELAVERLEEDGGFLQRIRRLLPGGAEEAQAGRLAWSEPATGPHFTKAITLDLGDAEPGEYRLLLRATSASLMEFVEAERTFQVR